MPSFVDPSKCDGCKGGEKTACMYICPNDLMVLNTDEMRAYNQEPDACWECYSCVKICPQGAIEVRAYSDIVPLGGLVAPLMSSDSIMWTIRFRNGNLKRFKFPIRTTPEGSINPQNDKKGANLNDSCLYNETVMRAPDAAHMVTK
ncbi:MAG: adenylyl-sulfate reductase subunit beta [Nitrospirae bacterium]|nr:adenylyl-sulfate reductase subunit beta [Nitrospirota bacterium]